MGPCDGVLDIETAEESITTGDNYRILEREPQHRLLVLATDTSSFYYAELFFVLIGILIGLIIMEILHYLQDRHFCQYYQLFVAQLHLKKGKKCMRDESFVHLV